MGKRKNLDFGDDLLDDDELDIEHSTFREIIDIDEDLDSIIREEFGDLESEFEDDNYD